MVGAEPAKFTSVNSLGKSSSKSSFPVVIPRSFLTFCPVVLVRGCSRQNSTDSVPADAHTDTLLSSGLLSLRRNSLANHSFFYLLCPLSSPSPGPAKTLGHAPIISPFDYTLLRVAPITLLPFSMSKKLLTKPSSPLLSP